MNDKTTDTFEGWAVLELMGHRRLAGYISEAGVAGVPAMRIDIYRGLATEPTQTQFYTNAAAIYAVTPASEELCRRFSENTIPQPISPFELPDLIQSALHPRAVLVDADDDHDDDCRDCDDLAEPL